MRKVTSSVLVPVLFAVMLLACTREKEAGVSITGTSVSLRPPEGFSLIAELGGFKHDYYAATIVVSEVPSHWNTLKEEFAPAKFAALGWQLLSQEPVKIADREGILNYFRRTVRNTDIHQYILLLPEQDYSVVIKATFEAAQEKALGNDIRRSLLSARVEDRQQTFRNHVPFEISVGDSSLKLARILPGPSVLFTADGTWSDSSIHRSSFFAGRSIPKMEGAGNMAFARSQLLQLCPDCLVDSTSINRVTIDSLKGFELWGYTQNSNKLKYQALLFDSSSFYLMVGTASHDLPRHLELFRSASRTFQRKQ